MNIHVLSNPRLMLTVCLLGLLIRQLASAQTYTITLLPPLEGDTDSAAYALNESGQAAGSSGNRAVIWTDGVPQSIQTIGTSSVAFALNDLGHAAGDVSPTVAESGAFIWRNGVMQRIVPPSEQYIVEAYAMNNSDTVVGTGGTTFAWRWTGGSYGSLNFLPNDWEARPFAVNNLGIAAGRSSGPTGSRPVIWPSSTPQPLPLPDNATQGLAGGLNYSGLVVGEYYSTGVRRPFAWSSATGAITLPLPSEVTRGYAWAVNNAGDIIGEADGQPVLWRKNAAGAYEVVSLADRVPDAPPESSELSLYAINEAGQIAGEGLVNGEWRGFVLSPKNVAFLSVLTVNRDDPFAAWDAAVELPPEAPVYAGAQSGDLMAFRAVTSHPTANYRWTAQSIGGSSIQAIAGPEGTGATEWKMNQGDFNWPPGTYTVQCEVSQNGNGLEVLSVSLTVGWRTSEYVVVGQVKPIADFTIDADRRAAIRNALINSYFVPRENFLTTAAKNTLQLLPLEENLKMWTAFQFLRYAVTDMSDAPPFVRLPGVSTNERFWVVQSLLNQFPDETNLSVQLEPEQLTELRAQRSYRMYGRVQFRYRLATDGAIDPDSVVALRKDFDNGPTKFAQPPELLMPSGSITMRGVEFDLQGNSNQSFISSEPIPGSGSVTLAADRRSLSFYFGGRVGLEGRVPNFALFHRDAPFIFTEIIVTLGQDGRDTGSRIRLSVDKVWSPTGVTGSSHFNEIRIYRRSFLSQGAVFQLVDDGAFLIGSQLAPFIQSGSSTWPGLAPIPSIQ